MDTNMRYSLAIARARVGFDLLRMWETWTCPWALAFALGNIVQIPFKWLQDHTAVDHDCEYSRKMEGRK